MKASSKILLALVAGAVLGALARWPAAAWLLRGVIAVEPLGTVFIRLVTMVVVPLVVASLFVGIASLNQVSRVGRLGGRTLAYFAVTTLLAAIVGLTVARLSHVGQGVDPQIRQRVASRSDGQTAAPPAPPTFTQMLINMTPQNPVAAAAQADLLPLIIAVCIFGAAATLIPIERRRIVVGFFEGVNDLAMVVIGWTMRLAPAAVLVLIAAVVARSGADVLHNLLVYALVVVTALAVHVLIVLAPALRLIARMGVVAFVRTSAEALLLAFSTASSSATLPVSMAAARRLGISSQVSSFVLSSGTTINKNGAAVYKAVTAVFLLELYGLPLGPAQMLTIVVTSAMAAFAGAGIPGSSLVTTLIVLNAVGLGPNAAAGIALVAGIDRPLDMCRTMVNTIGNLVGAAVVARREGERPSP
jgi:Na+/H+-dicarboxylate symporter